MNSTNSNNPNGLPLKPKSKARKTMQHFNNKTKKQQLQREKQQLQEQQLQQQVQQQQQRDDIIFNPSQVCTFI